MTGIDKLAAAVYLPMEKTAVNVVADAFAINLVEDNRYIESDIVLESLDLASFVASGLGAVADAPEPGEVRTTSTVTLDLADSAENPGTAGRAVTLYGPGDVVGLAPGMIIRRHPAPNTQTAEVTDLAHIEFDRPELPWAFSAAPARGAKTMRPWLALVVVRRAAVVRWDSVPGLPPRMFVPSAELPPLKDAHLWGHAQAQRSEASLSARLSPEFAPVNLSRLVSSRVLEPNTDYVAALVPITDVGTRRGLGGDGGTLGYAWHPDAADTAALPVYDRWEFRTGGAGDFATLALRLRGVRAPWQVGRRLIDASSPGHPMTRELAAHETGAKQILRCALFSPVDPPDEVAKAREQATWPDDMVGELAEALNAPAELGNGAADNTDGFPDLPIVGPRLYARAQRGTSAVSTAPGSDWFAQLNLSPMNRIVAGLGTRVVQHDQEQLMAAAWAQIGEVRKVNRAIALARFAEQVALRLHVRIGNFQRGRLLQVTAPLVARVSVTAGRTLAADIKASATPVATVSGAFRRALRPHGPVIGRATDAVKLAGTLVGTDSTMRNFTRTYVNPDGVTALGSASIATLDAGRVASVLDVPEGTVVRRLKKASTDMKGGLLAHLADQGTWSAAPADFDVATVIAAGWREAIVKESSIPVVEKIRKQRVGPIAAELAVSTIPAVSTIRAEIEGAAIRYNNSVIATATSETTSVSRSAPATSSPLMLPPRGTVGRTSLANGVAAAGAGRAVTDVPGVSRIDTSALRRITARTSADATKDALTRFARLSSVRVAPLLEKAESTSAAKLRAMIPTLIDPGGVSMLPPVPVRSPVSVGNLVEVLDPRRTVRESLRGRLSSAIGDGWISDVFAPVTWAPKFDRPMSQALQDYDDEWLVPGMEHLPDEDFVTVLSMNRAFVEAFLIGLSDEFGRELLWRGFPADQRGTYFRRFWSADTDELSSPIHRLTSTALGGDRAMAGGDGAERAVILVKGELIRRYPDVTIQAATKSGNGSGTRFTPARQLFAEHLADDTVVVGVDLSITEMRSDGWVLISEHPTATRFDSMHATGSFVGADGRETSATWAKDHIHKPIQVAFPAADVIKLEG